MVAELYKKKKLLENWGHRDKLNERIDFSIGNRLCVWSFLIDSQHNSRQPGNVVTAV